MTTQPNVSLTPERALELLRKARDLKGADYVYRPETLTSLGIRSSGCRYREPGGAPSCIAGHVFMWAGVTEMPEGKPAARVAHNVGLSDEVARILNTAQIAQDNGATWGEAVAVAEREAMRLGVAA